jgi:hypothetical protein
VVDRVVTFGTVFMGMTFDCTRCHDHKYDPFTMQDFYSLFAYFNSMDGKPLDGNIQSPPPVLKVMQPAQKKVLQQSQTELASVKKQIDDQLATFEYNEPSVESEPTPIELVWVEDEVPKGASAQGGWTFVSAPSPVFSGKKASTRTAKGLSQHFFQNAPKPQVIQKDDLFFTYVYLDPKNPPKEIMLQWNDGNWEHRVYWGENRIDWGKVSSPARFAMGKLPETGKWVRLEVAAEVVGLKPGAKINGWAFTQFDGTVYWDKAGIVRTGGYHSLARWEKDQRNQKAKGLPKPIQTAVLAELEKQTGDQKTQIKHYFFEHVLVSSRSVFEPLHDQVAKLQAQSKAIEAKAPSTLIFREKKDLKPAFMLERGEYDQKKDQVQRRTPTSLPPLPEKATNDRLGLAQWLIDPQHPLTARVAVNFLWQQVFGTGLVKTAEDFGVQGERPSHPEILDYLAVDFRENGWDVKRLMKMLVMSDTYQQSSVNRPELLKRDPENRLLARGPRFRLDAEMLRDQALAVSGLLVELRGGPSVKPPQPDGLWFAVGYSGSNTVRFKPDQGSEKVHRRTLYTFIKRTALAPQCGTFDAPSREATTMRRERTNTPLQALLLMNDPQFVEAAGALAGLCLGTTEDHSTKAVARSMFHRVTCRLPTTDELEILVMFFKSERERFEKDKQATDQLLAVVKLGSDSTIDRTDLAAWTLVANLVLNLDEVVTKN